jgi:hypothetical protein
VVIKCLITAHPYRNIDACEAVLEINELTEEEAEVVEEMYGCRIADKFLNDDKP